MSSGAGNTITGAFPPMSFVGVTFPVESIKISGGIRYHVHEFPHMAGGAPEKLGRSLYRVTVVGNFQDVFRAYPYLYPDGLITLIDAFEMQRTDKLTVPTLGTFDAFALKWDREWSSKILSGEKVTIEFLEDQSSSFQLNQILSLKTDTHGADLAASYAAAKADIALADAPKLATLMDALQATVNSLAAIQDQASLYGNLFEAKLSQIVNMCDTIDRLGSMDDPNNWALVESVHQLWSASIGRLADTLSKRTQLLTFTVPTVMGVGSVASAIYRGDSTRVDDLMTLNNIPDPQRIPAGTSIRYYP